MKGRKFDEVTAVSTVSGAAIAGAGKNFSIQRRTISAEGKVKRNPASRVAEKGK